MLFIPVCYSRISEFIPLKDFVNKLSMRARVLSKFKHSQHLQLCRVTYAFLISLFEMQLKIDTVYFITACIHTEQKRIKFDPFLVASFVTDFAYLFLFLRLEIKFAQHTRHMHAWVTIIKIVENSIQTHQMTTAKDWADVKTFIIRFICSARLSAFPKIWKKKKSIK